MKKLQNHRGFTLIELMVAMAIVAIMSAIAFPFFGDFLDNRNLKSAARDLAGDIFQLKEQAIAEDRLYQISFDQGGNTYKFGKCLDTALPCNLDNTTTNTKSPSAFQNGIVISALSLPAGTVIQIQPRGIINPVGSGTVTLRNGKGSQARINISLTGRTSVDWTGTLQ